MAGMDRTRTAVSNFAINFGVGYVAGRLLRDRETGVRAGLALGTLSAVASWRLADRFGDGGGDGRPEPIEIEIDE